MGQYFSLKEQNWWLMVDHIISSDAMLDNYGMIMASEKDCRRQ